MRTDLVERARQGDRDAFALLAADAIDRLYAIARLVLRDSDLAEDAVQEALVRCWRELPKLREPARFDAWMYRILMRTAANELARRRRHERAVQVLPAEPAIADSTSEIATRDELDGAFRRLTLEHRAVIVLHEYLGLPLADVAAALGIPAGTAKSRYHYAMSALRAALAAETRLAAEAKA